MEQPLGKNGKNDVLSFYRGKRVFVTGHTGFKGSWLCHLLSKAGAKVTGFSLNPPTIPSLYEIDHISEKVHSIIGDVRDYDALKKAFEDARPEIVFHLAAQPLVRLSYEQPRFTYETNVIGTLNVLECVRLNTSVRSFLNVTTDKVYENSGLADHEFSEEEKLDGFDPYSNSKSCSELLTHAYKKSFLRDIPVSTARAGNVIGGGDFAADRIFPDCFRAAVDGREIVVRHPFSTRPYQHVLEPIFAYLQIAKEQYENPEKQGWYNVGPDDEDCFQTGALVNAFVKYWGNGLKWISVDDGGPHEEPFLKLNCAKLKSVFGWRPIWGLETAIAKTVEWYRRFAEGADMETCLDRQIEEFVNYVER